MKFRKLSPTHKRWYIISRLFIYILIITSIGVAVAVTDISLPSEESKLSVSGGFIILSMIGTLAIFNRIRAWFKMRSGKFVIAFVLMMIIKYVVDTAIWGIGLVLIPLLLDDLIITPYWKVVWEDEYED